jgi:2-methylcitrate dehydratase PrpD
VGHLIIGGGAEGDKTVVRTKEEADHSLPYIVAVAALDGEVMGPSYRAGVLRHRAIEFAHRLECEHGVEFVFIVSELHRPAVI